MDPEELEREWRQEKRREVRRRKKTKFEDGDSKGSKKLHSMSFDDDYDEEMDAVYSRYKMV